MRVHRRPGDRGNADEHVQGELALFSDKLTLFIVMNLLCLGVDGPGRRHVLRCARRLLRRGAPTAAAEPGWSRHEYAGRARRVL